MSALLVGAVLAALALAFVLHPLFKRQASTRDETATDTGRVPPDVAVRALREIEFDRATGKLSDADYEGLKAQYTARALAEMRAQPASTTAAADLAELLIRNARAAGSACRRCGTPPPEPDAVYCSTCGAYLPGACAACGASIDEIGARFCTSCGTTLAA
jgi:cytochrome c-type biogenesis protein CcmI